ncbi:MAG: putative transposase [Gammaproteobacteria bacterium]|jgi:putative transposase
MMQIGRNLTDLDDGTLAGTRYLIHDRDPLFTEAFRGLLQSRGVNTVKLPARSPNLNAFAERFVRSIKSECLAHILPLGERHLRTAVKEYTEHYRFDRSQQGLNNQLIEQARGEPNQVLAVGCGERLGGILKYYYRCAA